MKFRLRSLPAGWEVGPMAISWCVVIRGNQEAGGTKKERATGVERGPTLEKKKWSLTGTFSGTPQVAPMRLWRVNGRVTYPETACVPFSCQTPRVLPFFLSMARARLLRWRPLTSRLPAGWSTEGRCRRRDCHLTTRQLAHFTGPFGSICFRLEISSPIDFFDQIFTLSLNEWKI